MRTGRLARGAAIAVIAWAAVARAERVDSPDRASPAEQARRAEALRTIEQTVRASGDARRRIETEIAGLRADRTRLAAALVAAADRTREAEERARAAERRLDGLMAQETGLQAALGERRAAIADLLATLQALGLHPPPALLVRPDNVLEAIRAAMLLGATVPGLREQARALSDQVAELGRVRSSIAADRTALNAEYTALAAERDRMAALVAARQERIAAAEADVASERGRSERLAEQARSLRDLIERQEREDRDAPAPPPPAPDPGEAMRQRLAEASEREPVRLAPRQAFAALRGTLQRPATGPVLRAFGAPDGGGGTARGISIGTRAGAVVTAIADGSVVFAGPFRSYGRLLIINAGGGYYLTLAGMENLSVEVGQFVLAGEPVGLMGQASVPSAALGVVEADGPVLYVELRKDGGPIDPGPWWARSQSERARG